MKDIDSLSKRRPKGAWADKWAHLNIRTYSRDYLRDLGKIPGMQTFKNGEYEDKSMNQVLEVLINLAGSKLVHNDMGAGFTHQMTPYCACEPEWPDE